MNTPMWDAVWKEVLLFLPRLPVSAALLLAFWIGGRVVQGIIFRLGALRRVDANVVSFLGRMSRLALITLGTIMAVGTIGIDVSSLVAGLGLTGFALGFALKDVISNALSGILIIVYKPFGSSDRVAMAPFEGTVLEVNLRYTVLDAGEKKVFIPNSLLFTNPITVETKKEPTLSGPQLL